VLNPIVAERFPTTAFLKYQLHAQRLRTASQRHMPKEWLAHVSSYRNGILSETKKQLPPEKKVCPLVRVVTLGTGCVIVLNDAKHMEFYPRIALSFTQK